MSRVRIEIYPDDENFDEVQYAEAQYPDVREAFDRAVAMARVALPEKPLRQPCGQRCADPGGDCTDTCAKPAGHDDWHATSDGECTWNNDTPGEADPARCGGVCGYTTCWTDCQRPKDHRGEHRCNRPKDHERCLNEIGPPSAARNCHLPLNHEGECGNADD
jgi:hypothetical protein